MTGDKMTWEELKEKAKEMGYLVCLNGDCIKTNDDTQYNHTLFYYRDGIINVKHFGNFCFVAEHRTPEQMLMIMKGLE